MIDCHAHAFPALTEHVEGALDRLGNDAGFILRDAFEGLRGFSGRARQRVHTLAERLPMRPPSLGIERVAEVTQRIPKALRGPVESLAGLGLLPKIALRGTVDHLFASMDRLGIERAVVIAAPPLASNDWLLKEIWPKARARVIPVATLPVLPAPATAGEQEWGEAFEALAQAGARGFKIHPNMDGLSAGHPAYHALFTVARAHKLFVILHTGHFHVLGYKKSGATDLGAFAPLFTEFKDVRVCLAHMNREEPEQAWELMRAHEQLFADTSWQPEHRVSQALREVGPRRVLLGSDWPLLHGDLQADALGILRKAASEQAFERVVKYTPLVFLGEA